jgi:ABC-type antimicrobial peptide transport system permease subunit
MLALVRRDETAALERLRRWILSRWPLFEAETIPLSTVLSVQIYPFRAAAWIGWMLGLLAMVLTVSGMYGVMSYLVSQRSKEIGIRMALGAAPSNVIGLVMKRSARLAGIGALIGGGFAAVAVKLLLVWSGRLQILGWDNIALLTGVSIAGAAALAAALGPSSRAARLDPNTVLRAD